MKSWFTEEAHAFQVSMILGTVVFFTFGLLTSHAELSDIWLIVLYFLLPGLIATLSGYATKRFAELIQWIIGVAAIVLSYLACETIYGSFGDGWWGAGFSYISILYLAPTVMIGAIIVRLILAMILLIMHRWRDR